MLNALAGLSTQQGPAALNAISGQPYADFGTHERQQRRAVHERARPADGQRARRRERRPAPGAGPGLRVAAATPRARGAPGSARWAAWVSVLGDGNASTLTYNFGGAAAGIDYRLDPRFLVGIGVGYTHGTQWVNSFLGQGWSDSVSVAAYGSFTQGGFYVDALAGYAYFNNQLQRQILIPGLQQRTANGSDRRQPVPRPGRGRLQARRLRAGCRDHHAVRPLPDLERDAERLQRIGRQLAQPQRGAADHQLAAHHHRRRSGRRDRPRQRAASSTSRFGWAGMHEFADTGRPITAAFAGAPGNAFTVLRRHAAAQRRRDRLLGQHQHRRGDLSSTCATTARSAPAPTTMRSMSACA